MQTRRWVQSEQARCWKCLALQKSVDMASTVENRMKTDPKVIDEMAKKLEGCKEEDRITTMVEWAAKKFNSDETSDGRRVWPEVSAYVRRNGSGGVRIRKIVILP